MFRVFLGEEEALENFLLISLSFFPLSAVAWIPPYYCLILPIYVGDITLGACELLFDYKRVHFWQYHFPPSGFYVSPTHAKWNHS